MAFIGNNKKEKMTMNIKEATKVLTAATVVAGMTMCASASIWSAVAKGCDKALPRATERGVVKAGGKVAGKVAASSAGHLAASGLRSVKPSTILATGAAIGIVEVGHGAQKMQQSFGRTVEEHPELAPQVADKFAKPIAAVSKTVAVLLALLVLWFAWPFIRCTRAVLKMWCSRRSRLDGTVEKAGTAPDRRILVGVAFAFLVATFALGFSGCDRVDAVECSEDSAPCPSADTTEAYRKEILAAKARFEHGLVAGCREDFADVRAMIPEFVKKYGYYSHCCELAKCLVWDRLTGKSSTEQKVKDDVEGRFYRSIVEARTRMIDRVRTFARELEGVRTRFGRPDVVGGSCLSDDASSFADLLDAVSDNIDAVKNTTLCEQNEADFTLVVETVMIRETVAAVATLLEAIVAREAVAVGTAGAASAADGPLPFGECVGAIAVVGMSAWSGWDIYKVAKVLPRELTQTLEKSVDACAEKSAAEGNALAESLVELYLRAN